MREHRRDTNKTVNADGLMQHSEDDFGNHLASRLSHQGGRLDAVVSERLRVARMRALAMRKLAPSGPRMANGGWSKTFAPWTTLQLKLASVVPVVSLLVGLWLIDQVQSDRNVIEKAAVDYMLLTDKLPLAAFTDSGFAEFLKSKQPFPDRDECNA